MRGGLEGLVVKSEFPSSTPKFNSSTVSYEPASGLSTPTHPDGRAQHELRTPAMESLKSTRQVLQSVSSSKSLNLGMYNARRLASGEEETTVPCCGHPTPFCFDRPNGLGNYVGVSHGQVQSLPSGYHAISESRREQDVQRLRGEAVQVPMADEQDYFLDRVCSSQLKLPVKVDVCDGLDRVPPPIHSQEFPARLNEHGLSSWAQPRTPTRTTTTVDISSMSRPSPTFHDVRNVHKTPACDKGVLSHESRKLGMGNSGGSGCINPRKSSSGVESRSFELAGSKRHSRGRDGIIMISDSEEEEHHNIEVDPGVLDDEGLLDRRIPSAMEGLSDELESRFTIMTGRLKDSPPFHWNSELLSLNVSKVKEGRSRSRLESEDGGWLSRSRTRKERDDEDRTDIFGEGKRAKTIGFISEEQVLTSRVSLPRNRSGLDAQAFVRADSAPCVKLEREYQSEQNAVWQSGDHRNEKHHASTFNYGSRYMLSSIMFATFVLCHHLYGFKDSGYNSSPSSHCRLTL